MDGKTRVSSMELVSVGCTEKGEQVIRTSSYDVGMKAKHEGRWGKKRQKRRQIWSALLRPCLCEFVLTALFVGSSAMGGTVSGDIVQVAFLNGFAIYTLIMIGLDISGAQMNPAVSVGIFLSGGQALDVTLSYIFAQLLGATAGGSIARGLVDSNSTSFPETFALVLPHSENQSHFQSMLTEAFLAFILVLLVLVTIVEKDAKDMFGPLVVGIWVGTAILAGGKLSGGSMNPARTFGAALAFNNGWDVVWVYVGGGVIGAISASVGYRFFFSKRTLRRPFLTVLQSEESDE